MCFSFFLYDVSTLYTNNDCGKIRGSQDSHTVCQHSPDLFGSFRVNVVWTFLTHTCVFLGRRNLHLGRTNLYSGRKTWYLGRSILALRKKGRLVFSQRSFVCFQKRLVFVQRSVVLVEEVLCFWEKFGVSKEVFCFSTSFEEVFSFSEKSCISP